MPQFESSIVFIGCRYAAQFTDAARGDSPGQSICGVGPTDGLRFLRCGLLTVCPRRAFLSHADSGFVSHPDSGFASMGSIFAAAGILALCNHRMFGQPKALSERRVATLCQSRGSVAFDDFGSTVPLDD